MSTPFSSETARIQDILEQLDKVQETRTLENRRQAPRIALRARLTAILSARDKSAVVSIFCRNISSSGIGFVSRRPFQTDERIAIALRLEKMPAKLVLARIVFARYVSGSLYQMGAEFLECMNDPEGTAVLPAHWLSKLPAPLPGAATPTLPPPAAGPTPTAPNN